MTGGGKNSPKSGPQVISIIYVVVFRLGGIPTPAKKGLSLPTAFAALKVMPRGRRIPATTPKVRSFELPVPEQVPEPAVDEAQAAPAAAEPAVQSPPCARPAAPPSVSDNAPSSKKMKKERAPKEKGIGNWTPAETAVRTARTSAALLLGTNRTSFSAQAATRALVSACERWSSSPENYRMSKTNESYPLQLVAICGPEGAGDGQFGEVPFPVKMRPGSEHGAWDMKASMEKRPKLVSAIYSRAKLCVRKVTNVYEPLAKKLLVDGGLRSGWTEDDLHACMLYNLQAASEPPTVTGVQSGAGSQFGFDGVFDGGDAPSPHAPHVDAPSPTAPPQDDAADAAAVEVEEVVEVHPASNRPDLAATLALSTHPSLTLNLTLTLRWIPTTTLTPPCSQWLLKRRRISSRTWTCVIMRVSTSHSSSLTSCSAPDPLTHLRG